MVHIHNFLSSVVTLQGPVVGVRNTKQDWL